MTVKVGSLFSPSCPSPGSEWSFVVCGSGNKLCYIGDNSERIEKI